MKMYRKVIKMLDDRLPSLAYWIRIFRYAHSSKRNTFAQSEINDFFISNNLEGNIQVLRKDIYNCFLKYGATPAEYFLMGFYGSSDEVRESFLTDEFRERILEKITGKELAQKDLNNKYNFYKKNSSYFGRKAIMCQEGSYEEFENFVLSRGKVFIKPVSDSCGRGAGLYAVATKNAANRLYKDLISNGDEWMVEEYIVQSTQMSQWNPSSVNTVRIPAFLTNKGFYVLAPFIRFGTSGAVVDNAGAGGVFANIDVATGKICTKGIDELNRQYDVHPTSGIKFLDWQVPKWKELMALVEEIHRKNMSSHIYIGWDFALTDKGWILIEGNWGQLVSQYADKQGRKASFVKYMSYGPVQE